MHEIDPGQRRKRNGALALAVGACLCAGQLLGATPALADVATTAPSTSTTTTTISPVTPRVSIGASRSVVPWGTLIKVAGRVINPTTGRAVAGVPASLQVWTASGWRTVRTANLSPGGYVWLWSRPKVSTSYRMIFAGQVRSGVRVLNPVASGYTRVTVRPSGAQIVAVARSLTGRPYRYGAAGPWAFDCSGYTQYVVRKVTGRTLPHRANSQQYYGRWIAKSYMRPGDLIFIRSGTYAYHAAIYAGQGYMYDSPRPGRTVGKHKIWSRNFVVRRFV